MVEQLSPRHRPKGILKTDYIRPAPLACQRHKCMAAGLGCLFLVPGKDLSEHAPSLQSVTQDLWCRWPRSVLNALNSVGALFSGHLSFLLLFTLFSICLYRE